jgi:hypothetical protein
VRGQILVPAPHPAQLKVGAAAKQRRKHHPNDLAQKFLLASQAAFNLNHQLSWKAQVMEGLLQGLSGLLRLAAVTLKALLCFEAAALFGFGLLFGVSCAWGHGALLCSIKVYAG